MSVSSWIGLLDEAGEAEEVEPFAVPMQLRDEDPTMDIALGNRSEESGCFNFVLGADGDVAFDDTEAHVVMTSIVEDKGQNPFDPRHGSELYKITSLTGRTPSQAEAVTLEALAPLEADSMIDPDATRVSASRSGNALLIDVTWESPTGKRSRQLLSL